jgi:secreted trypsin-like serine protease
MRLHALTPLAAALSLLAAGCSSDAATAPVDERVSLVTNGTLAGSAHPEVVLIVMEVAGSPAFLCSGTLLTPTIVLTAGHCTGEPGEFSGMRVFTESDVDNGTNNFPFAGPNAVEAAAFATHPDYVSAQFALNDVGVIRLAEPVALPAGASYGTLPAANSLNTLRTSGRIRFESVGYGLQSAGPKKAVGDLKRRYSNPFLLQINTGSTGSYSMLLSNNTRTGGTCFGDSGGPNYLGSSTVIAGVTSYGRNPSCAGTGGVFRMDRPDVLAFVQSFLP